MIAPPGRPGRDAPDLPVLPPVIPLTALVLAVVLKWSLPLGYLPRPLAPITTILGLLLAAARVGCAIWGAMAFRRAGTNADPRRPSLVVVDTGPFRFTRNPMYLGFLQIFPGIGLIASLDWALPILPLLWLALDRLIVVREEAYLAGKFGASCKDFRDRTRRWLW